MKKINWIIKTLFFIVLLSFFLLIRGCAPEHDGKEAFEEICDDLFVHIVSSDSITLNYNLSKPERYNIHMSSPTLGKCSVTDSQSEYAYYENILSRLNHIKRGELHDNDRVTYDILTQTLSLYNEGAGFVFYEEPLSPVTGIQASLPLLLCEYHFYTPENVPEYFALLRCVPEYFKNIADYETLRKKHGFCMSRVQADVIIKQCTDFVNDPGHNYLIETFPSRLEALDIYDEDHKNKLITENTKLVNEYVIPAYKFLINYLGDLKNENRSTESVCAGTKRGKEYYEYLLRFTTGSDKTPREAYKLIENTLEECRMKLAANNSYNRTEICPYTSGEEIINHLRNSMSSNFPRPGRVSSINIKKVHPSLEDTSSPALYISPPIDIPSDDCIYINDSLCKGNSVFTTLAHEGYPGHLLQTRYFMNTNPHPVRLVLNFGGYVEGWATYAELMSCDYMDTGSSFSDACRNNKLAILCIYSLIDIGIHYYGYSETDCIKILHDNGLYDSSAGKDVYLTVLSEPALYTKYTLGCIEFLELKKKAQKKEGRSFSPYAFHEKILKMGPCPFNMLDF